MLCNARHRHLWLPDWRISNIEGFTGQWYSYGETTRACAHQTPSQPISGNRVYLPKALFVLRVRCEGLMVCQVWCSGMPATGVWYYRLIKCLLTTYWHFQFQVAHKLSFWMDWRVRQMPHFHCLPLIKHVQEFGKNAHCIRCCWRTSTNVVEKMLQISPADIYFFKSFWGWYPRGWDVGGKMRGREWELIPSPHYLQNLASPLIPFMVPQSGFIAAGSTLVF